MDQLLDIIPPWYFQVVAFVFGTLWGSFANVVIVRWPLEMSVLRPASHCFSCNKPIAFYDNIPILSYLLLRGRCRYCKVRFSPRYMFVELMVGLLSVAVVRLTLLADPPTLAYGLAAYFIWFGFVWALFTAAVIDLKTFLLPDVITLSGIVVGCVAHIFVFQTHWSVPVIGAAASYAGLRLIFVHGYKLLTGHQGMGAGDPKLLAMIGAFLGLEGALFALFAGAFQGLFAGTILVIARRRKAELPSEVMIDEAPADEQTDGAGDEDEEDVFDPDEDPRFRKAKVPFGPFLALGAIEYFFAGGQILGLYSDLVNRFYGMFGG